MTDNMVQFDAGNTRFAMCARGIAIHEKRVLLFNVVGWHWWALPGGRVDMLEIS
jgi:ADP-ribose pyrophosphatase YjhB (NUDIX family)